MDKDYQEYKDFDMSGAVRGVPPQIARLQAKAKAEREQKTLIDDDVWQLIQQSQDPRKADKINGVLRAMFA